MRSQGMKGVDYIRIGGTFIYKYETINKYLISQNILTSHVKMVSICDGNQMRINNQLNCFFFSETADVLTNRLYQKGSVSFR